ncbi:MAG: hypothetical protein ACTHME_05220 [Candidatus Nitrosocosmicus sp.]
MNDINFFIPLDVICSDCGRKSITAIPESDKDNEEMLNYYKNTALCKICSLKEYNDIESLENKFGQLSKKPIVVNVFTNDSPEIIEMKVDQAISGKEFIEGEREKLPKLINIIDFKKD